VEDFSRILDQYQDKVYRLACGMLGDEASAQDAAQDTFVRVWKGLGTFRGESSLSTWIFTIARRTCLDALKARRKTVALEEARDVAQPIRRDGDLDIEALLRELPERTREAVTLFYLYERSYDEVAKTMNVPLSTVKNLLYRARQQMILRVMETKLKGASK
jgi:RNA polymerase sigma-70 factor (ECF subfamily)